jgi:transcriptional regulator with XRE-family HTH domain
MTSKVYFIRAGKDGPVKIGVAFDTEQRRKDLQVANHADLTVIRTVKGTSREENQAHKKFAHLCIRGEWFAFDQEMLTWKPKKLAKWERYLGYIPSRLADWRQVNGLTLRAAAALFGMASAGNLLEIERGETWVGPQVLSRIMFITEALGPFSVSIDDLVDAWRIYHSEEIRKMTKNCAKLMKRFIPQRESPNGKERKGKGVQERQAKGGKAGQGRRSGDQRHQEGSRPGKEPQPYGREENHRQFRRPLQHSAR